ncbi:MAG: DUF1015 domain-containing protein, partial [Lachnospiraceae bacterium]|nr:DUF1015 domain-containing protein [Lachnospiraceae bacterium]
MADVIPFKAIRPKKEYAEKTASLPYDVFSRKEAKEAVPGRPLSFLNIDRPETQFPDGYDMYADEVYKKGREMLWEQIAEGIYEEDEKPCYYIYELTAGGRTQTGIAALSSVDDYINGIVKKHENTRPEKEQDRIRHIDVLDAQTGPIFLAYRDNAVLSEIISAYKEKEPEYDFVYETGIRNRVFVIDDDKDIAAVKDAFAGIERTYIADGHHRAASAVKVALKRRAE